MRLKNSAFVNNVTVNGASNCDWGTEIGQSEKHTFTLEGFPEILNAMVYYKIVDEANLKVILGKGTRSPKSFEEYAEQSQLVLASRFTKIFLNDTLLEGQSLIMYLIKDIRQKNSKGEANVHFQRCQLKFSNSLEYNGVPINQNCIDAITQKFGLGPESSWAVLDFEIENEDELHLYGFSISDKPVDYIDKNKRNKEFAAFFEQLDYPNLKKARLLRDSVSNHRNFDVQDSLQQIFYGAPGTGKSHTTKEITKNQHAIRTTFHPDTDYASFVGAYKPTTIEEPVMTIIGEEARPVKNLDKSIRTEKRIVYEFVFQSFLKAYVAAWKMYAEAEEENNVERQYLIIEEINRGNCAQIFGDIFQLLDRNDAGFSDYPIHADADMEKHLKKAFEGLSIPLKDKINSLYDEEGRDVVGEVLTGKILLLPNNLYIWATMNTSDQSLFPIDSAFKRRWDWKYMPITNANKNYVIEVGKHRYDWWNFLTAINDKIDAVTFSADKKLGYFFYKTRDGIIPADKFVGKVLFYLWNDVFKDYEFADSIFDDTIDGGKLYFDKFYQTDITGETTIVEEKVELFLANLKLQPINPDSTENSDAIQNAKIFVNGNPVKYVNEIPSLTIQQYVDLNQEKTAEEVYNFWEPFSKYSLRTWIIDNEATHAGRVASNETEANYSFPIKCKDGHYVWVNKDGWTHNPQKNMDTISKFIKAVHEANIQITIEEKPA